MQLSKKLEYVEQAVKSITTHTDVDAAVRAAALDRVIELVATEKKALEDEVKAEIEAALA